MRSSEDNCHEIHTTSSLAYIMFWTSIPGITRNLYISCSSEINFVCVRFLLSVSFPNIELRHSLARPRFEALYLIESLQLDAFNLIELPNVLIFISKGLNQPRIPTSLCFQFQKGVYIASLRTGTVPKILESCNLWQQSIALHQ
jgi:hypothetical protein